jgi:hypothetical protein
MRRSRVSTTTKPCSAFYDLPDLNPAKLHMTVPTDFRRNSETPCILRPARRGSNNFRAFLAPQRFSWHDALANPCPNVEERR